MSLDRILNEKKFNSDNRRVSFSLPRNKTMSSRHRESPKYRESAIDIEEEISAVVCTPVQPDTPVHSDTPVQSESLNSMEPRTEIKHKKKWKIVLPWKKKKAEYSVYSDDVVDKAHNIISESDSHLPCSSDSEKELAIKNESESIRKKKAFSWYGEPKSNDHAENPKALKNSGSTLPHTETEIQGDVKSEDNLKMKSKESSQKKSKSKFKFSYQASKPTYTSSDEELDTPAQRKEAFKSRREKTPDSKTSKSSLLEETVSKSNPNLVPSNVKERETSNLRKSEQFSDKYVVENLNFIASDTKVKKPFNKSNSLPSIFFKKSKKKKDVKKTFSGQENSFDDHGEEFDDADVPQNHDSDIDINVMVSEKQGHTETRPISPLTPNEDDIQETVPQFHLSSLPKKKKSRVSKNIYRMSRSTFIADFEKSKSAEALSSHVKTLENASEEIHDDKHKTDQLSKTNDFTTFKQISSLNSKNNLKTDHEEKMSVNATITNTTTTSTVTSAFVTSTTTTKHKKNKNNINIFPDSNVRVRRKSYEEMTNLIESEMFDYTDSDDSSDTDGDQVDLSFNRLLDDYDLQDKPSSSEYKLRRISDNGSLSETEIVYEPKLLSKKLQPRKSENIQVSSLERPSTAPPLPPGSVDKEKITSEIYITDKASQLKTIFGAIENEKTKKKKFKKTQKIRNSFNNSDSSSLEDNRKLTNGYNKREHNNSRDKLKEFNKTEVHKNIEVKGHDSDSPPNFLPPSIPDANIEISTVREMNICTCQKDINDSPMDNKLTLASATVVAKSLYTQREDNKNTISESNYIANLPIKNIKSSLAYKGTVAKPPSSPVLPPPVDEDPFSSERIPIAGSYNLKNFQPKYEYSSNMPFTSLSSNSKSQSNASYTSVYRDGTDPVEQKFIYNKNNSSSKTYIKSNNNSVPYKDVEQPLNELDRHEPFESFKYLQNEPVLPAEHKIIREEALYENTSFAEAPNFNRSTDYSDKPFNNNTSPTRSTMQPQEEKSNSLKKQIVTFHLPSTNKNNFGQSSPSELTITYNDFVHEKESSQRIEEQQENSTFRSLPKDYQYSHINDIPISSPEVQRQVFSMKQRTLRLPSNDEEFSSPPPPPPPKLSSFEQKEEYIPERREINNYYPYRHTESYAHRQNFEGYSSEHMHKGYIQASSPIPYSKHTPQLKSILRKPNYKSENRLQEETQPSLVHTNVTYIQPQSGEVRNAYQALSSQLIPSIISTSTTFNTNIERVEIDEESSDSDPEHIPKLPDYPPPPPRYDWSHHYQQQQQQHQHQQEEEQQHYQHQQEEEQQHYQHQQEHQQHYQHQQHQQERQQHYQHQHEQQEQQNHYQLQHLQDQQKQFFGELLTEGTSSPMYGQPTSQSSPSYSFSSAYYTPTIVEVDGSQYERESIYQNVIHASQV